ITINETKLLLSGTLGYSSTKVSSFKNPIPPSISNLPNPEEIELRKSQLYISPSLKILRNIGKKDLCLGLDIGARVYILQSAWKYKYNSKAAYKNKSGQNISGIPNLASVDIFVHILFGALAQTF